MMNQRIRELYKEAFGYFPAPTGEPELEKFAELIVRECVVMAKGYEFGLGRKDELSKTMREHFGVEEQQKVVSKPKCSVCGTTENVKYMGGHQPYLCDSEDCIPY